MLGLPFDVNQIVVDRLDESGFYQHGQVHLLKTLSL